MSSNYRTSPGRLHVHETTRADTGANDHASQDYLDAACDHAGLTHSQVIDQLRLSIGRNAHVTRKDVDEAVSLLRWQARMAADASASDAHAGGAAPRNDSGRSAGPRGDSDTDSDDAFRARLARMLGES